MFTANLPVLYFPNIKKILSVDQKPDPLQVDIWGLVGEKRREEEQEMDWKKKLDNIDPRMF